LVRLPEGTRSLAGVTGEELAEVGGFGKAQATGDGRHRFVGVGEQSLPFQSDSAVDDVFDGLPGGGGGTEPPRPSTSRSISMNGTVTVLDKGAVRIHSYSPRRTPSTPPPS
jgi:hypothetical protein